MGIEQIIEMGAAVTLNVTAKDLEEYGRFLISETRRELEKAIIDDKADIYMTAEQVADMTGKSVQTVWRWSRTGYIKAYMFGNTQKFSSRELKEKFLNKK